MDLYILIEYQWYIVYSWYFPIDNLDCVLPRLHNHTCFTPFVCVHLQLC